MLEELLLGYLAKRHPDQVREGSKFFIYGLAGVFAAVVGSIGMALWAILKPLPRPDDFTQIVGAVSSTSVKNLQDNGLLFLWIHLNESPKLYVYSFPMGEKGVLNSVTVGDTVAVTILKSDLADPKRAMVVGINENGNTFGGVSVFIQRKSESKKYAWLWLFPAAAGLFFLYKIRERNVEMAWERERSRNLV